MTCMAFNMNIVKYSTDSPWKMMFDPINFMGLCLLIKEINYIK